jgi:hypothetical protein
VKRDIPRMLLYANASKYKNIDDDKLTQKIQKLVEEADKIDSIED